MDFHFPRKNVVLFAISIVITYTIVDLLEKHLLVQQWHFSLLEFIASIVLLYAFYFLFAKEPKKHIQIIKPSVFFFGFLIFVLCGILPIYLQVESFLIRFGGVMVGAGVMMGYFHLTERFST